MAGWQLVHIINKATAAAAAAAAAANVVYPSQYNSGPSILFAYRRRTDAHRVFGGTIKNKPKGRLYAKRTFSKLRTRSR